MNNPEVTQHALSFLRSGDLFHWNVLTMLAFVVYVYANEIEKRNWKSIAAGLMLISCQWFYEILNALIQHFSGHALWTVPTGTAYLMLIGVGVEIAFMFAVAGIIFVKILPEDPKFKIIGINNRLFISVAIAAFYSSFEIFLVKTPVFKWVYPWWGGIPVFFTVYLPYWILTIYSYDWKPRLQIRVIGSLLALDICAIIVFAGILKWI